MVRSSPRGSRVLSGALALALALVPVATCVAAIRLTEPTHHAPCHGMQTEDGASHISTIALKSQAQDCCSVQRAILGLGGAADALDAPAWTTAAVASPAPLRPFAFDSRAPIQSSPPTYLLISVFRI
jgi:hypothetical protein